MGAPPPEVVEKMAQATTEFFLSYEVAGFSGHTTDLAALPAASTIIPAVGRDSAGQPPHQAALAHADGYAVELRKLFDSG